MAESDKVEYGDFGVDDALGVTTASAPAAI